MDQSVLRRIAARMAADEADQRDILTLEGPFKPFQSEMKLKSTEMI